MTQFARTDWIGPVLEDIRDYLRNSDHDDMARDIDALLARHRDRLGPAAAEKARPRPVSLERPKR